MRDALKDLRALKPPTTSTQGDSLASYQLTMEAARQARDAFRRQLPIDVGDGRPIFPYQYDALNSFAARNNRSMSDILGRLTINDSRVVVADFSFMALITLQGLSAIESLKTLSVAGNRVLGTLAGIPVQSLEWLDASTTRISGDLSELSAATKLTELYVSEANCLESLEGVPTISLEVLVADRCSLAGDLAPLAGARRLRILHVSGNHRLTSLRGIQTDELEELSALWCNLSEDHSFLEQAPRLIKLDLRLNPGLKIDRKKFSPKVKISI
jgi:hypothetical protein